ncbi:MAG: 2-hydroxyacid dehydrogenase [Pseudomonadota bacterium]|nr:2-hydroxyacid dehydrogenase [Pseudomonadota bacterium]MED5226455.1 2-hydroxyacid dehydrogenase [Pseudomonadota bacterium]
MTEKPDVLIYAPWYEPAMKRLDEIATTHHLYLADDKEAFLKAHGPKCMGIGTMHYCPPSLMDACPNLKIILNFGVGYDGVDIPSATNRGVKVVNTPDVLNDCVADMAMALLLAGRRKVTQADRYIREGNWVKLGNFEYVRHVNHSKVGILGLGRIGLEIANRCAAFKMDISYHQRNERKDVPYKFFQNLEEMAADADILVAILPGGEKTTGLISEKIIKLIGPEGLLVNVARGTVVDNDALARCLKDGSLGAAALDVFPNEPEVPEAFLDIKDNLILTPHMASATHFTRMEMGMTLYNNLQTFLKDGSVLTPVN